MTRIERIAAVLAVFVAHSATIACAQTLKVRSGEHSGFTRLVVPLPTSTDWKLGRTATGYGLRVDLKGVTFDTSRVFDLIPRKRITALGMGGDDSLLRIDLACTCHAVATQEPNGQLILDFVDGAAVTPSPFEVPLDAHVASTEAGPQDLAHPLPHPTQRTTTPEGAFAATILFRPIVSRDGQGSVRWELRSDATAPKPVAIPPAGIMPSGTGETAISMDIPDRDNPVAESHSAGPALASPHKQVTEAELLRQLSRAAAQGLVRVDPLKLPEQPRSEESSVRSAARGPYHSDIGATRLKLPAIHIETSVDAATPGTGEPLTPEGDACIPDEDIAISSWGSDDPAAEQITTARQSLVGEFDRPNPQNIEILARLYLFLGLGAEARQTMVAFGVTMDGSGLLDDIGRILDDEPVASGSVLRRMQECNSAVALWAFLAAPEVEEARLTPVAAVVRGFLSLPPQLRLTLSTRLSDRLIEIGALDAARTIARSLSHQPDGDSRRASLIGARLDLKLGQTEQAEAQLAAIPAGNDALSASAIELATQTRLGRGERIDPKLVEAIASLAFEHQANPDGGRLASLEVVARASSGDFKGAFSALDRWSRDQPDMDRAATAHDLFDLLAKRATDSDFIVLFFRERQALQEARSDPQLRLSLGRRLAELGFAEEVAQVLSDETGNTKEGKILRARAELALFHPDAAIDLVEGLVGDDATQIRAQAKVMQGQSPSEVKPAAENRQTPEAARDEATGAVAGTLAGSRAMLQASTDLRQSILTSLAKDGAAAPQP